MKRLGELVGVNIASITHEVRCSCNKYLAPKLRISETSSQEFLSVMTPRYALTKRAHTFIPLCTPLCLSAYYVTALINELCE